MSQEKHKLNSLQAGRGIAAMLVVLHHASNHLKSNFGYLPLGGIFHFGRSGVDFFFVLSGFIIFFVHAKDIGHVSRLGRYLSRRFTRIFPIYWIVILIYLGIGFLTHKPIPIAAFLMDASLLPMAELNTLGVAWTLRYELCFYGMFALAIMSKRLAMLVIVVWVAGIILDAIEVLPAINSKWINLMISVWNVEFMFGMLAAYLLSKYTILLPKILLIFSLICFLFVGKLENQDILDGAADIARLPYGLLSMFILISLVEMERSGHLIVPRIFVLIGEASYSIYLIHLLFIGTAYKVLSYLGLVGELPLAVTLMLVFAAAIVGGVGVSMLLEIPAMNLTRKLLDRLSLPRFFTLRAKV